jgi:hypothetical protein
MELSLTGIKSLIELGPHPRLGCSRSSEILGCELLEPEHRPSVYPAGLFRLPKPRPIMSNREPAHEIQSGL